MSDINIRIEQAIETDFPLEKTGSWDDSKHFLDKKSAYAIIAAYNANRPLLVRGEPGVGKSQLARAAAYLLDRVFIAAVVQPDSDYEDMLWSFDHTRRLADAQLARTDEAIRRVEKPGNYIAPGPLWYALNWRQAEHQKCKNHFRPPEEITVEEAEKKGVVLLIDEVDKADIALANGLLEVLGNRRFSVPPTGVTVATPDKQKPPLVVLTSNDTRQLPEALQRRCVVLEIKLPGDQAGLIEHLVRIGATHHPQLHEEILTEAAEQIVEDRDQCHGRQKTGQAEYLDLLRALTDISQEPEVQRKWLHKLSTYFKKSDNS